MKKDEAKTYVYFKELEGEIIAVFPFEVWNRQSKTIASYMHIGQHGGACPQLMRTLPTAKDEDFKSLLKELEGIGYNLILDPTEHKATA
ncbi:MAG: hypothetical protein RIC03_07040 [Cyclobacteriaceae bacterium]